jgi:glutathione S-transferase
MKLYGSLASPYVGRAVLGARWKGLDLPLQAPPGGGIKSPEYLRMNPMGKMPTLESGGRFIAESMVILEYLDDASPQKSLLPADPVDRAHVRLMGRITDLYVMAHGGGLFRNMNPAQRNQADVDAAVAGLRKGLADLEHFMGNGPYALGKEPSQADCAMLPCLMMMSGIVSLFGIANLLEGRPKLEAWMKFLQTEPVAGPFMQEYAAAIQAFLSGRR